MSKLPLHIDNPFIENAEDLRSLGYKLVDMLVDYQKHDRETLWPPIMSGKRINGLIGETIPNEGKPFTDILSDIKHDIMPNCINTLQPKMMSLFSSPLSSAAFFDTITSFLNIQPYGQLSSSIEKLLISGIAREIGFSNQASGVLTSGGTSANLYGLAMARTSKMTAEVRKSGIFNASKLMLYTSTEAHSCIEKSVDMLGVGMDQIRKIDVDDNYRIKLDKLRSAIKQDVEMGFMPFCLVANVGSANVGAIDPLEEMAEISNEYNLWLHADGAYGSLAALTDKRKVLFNGLNKCDSLVLDFHKWFSIPYEAGCLMVQDDKNLIDTFNNLPGYINSDGIMSEVQRYTFELSKKDRGLTIWLTLKRYGLNNYRRLIDKHIDMVQGFATKVSESHYLELLCQPQLSICCFRFINPDHIEDSDKYVNNLNKAIKFAINANENTLVSGINIAERFYLRISLINYRTTSDDMNELLRVVVKYGLGYDQKMRKKPVQDLAQ